MSNDNKTLADVQPGGRVRLGDQARVTMSEDDFANMVETVAGEHGEMLEDGGPYNGWCFSCEELIDFSRGIITGWGWERRAQEYALSAQPSPGGQGDALAMIGSNLRSIVHLATVQAESTNNVTVANIHAEARHALQLLSAALAARQPVGEHAEGDEFLAGICVALQCVTAQDSGVLWAEIVRAVGVDDLLQYATFIEPEEWGLAGFSTYASTELNRRRPRSKAAKQAKRPPPQAVHHQAALLAEERAHGDTIDQCDRCEEVADELSARIASITGVDIGEHSSANCPWHNAIEAAEAYQPEQAVDPADPWRGLYSPDLMPKLDGVNQYHVAHPDLPEWPKDEDEERGIGPLVTAQGFALAVVFGEYPDDDGEEVDYCAWLASWTPDTPAGADWRLACIQDTEDGPAAFFVRPLALIDSQAVGK